MAGRKANWDTAYGYELYLEGKGDAEIADACGVKTSAVTSYRLKRWRKNPDGGRNAPPDERACEDWGDNPSVGCADSSPERGAERCGGESEREEVAGVPVEMDQKVDTARMMEVIAKMTSGMGGIKAVCVGNIIQALWNLSCVDDIREARNILDWLEENFDFG